MSDGAKVCGVWLASRALIFAVIVKAANHQGATLATALTRWDVQHYLRIASQGYVDPQEIAFFPGLPLILRAASVIPVPMWLFGTILAFLCSGLAAWALYRLYGVCAACLWLVAPMAVFTAVPYTEAPFAACAFWAWLKARESHWMQAGCLAAIACGLRISGLFLIFGLLVLAFTQAGRGLASKIRDMAPLALGLAVIGGYAGYLYSKTGSWTAWYSAQNQGWQRHLSWPWEGFWATWPMTSPDYWPNRPEVPVMFSFEIVAVLVGLVVVVATLVLRRWGEAAYAAATIIPLLCSGWFMSVNRAILLLFPLFGGLGRLGARHPKRVIFWGLVIIDLAVLVWWTYTFARGGWAS